MVDAEIEPEPQTEESQTEESETEEPKDFESIEKFDVVYSCLRCATQVSAIELERLPEIKCICGFRVFVKNRPPIVKSVNAV